MLAVSVPLEMSEYNGRTRTWCATRTGSGTSSTMMSLSPLRITCFMGQASSFYVNSTTAPGKVKEYAEEYLTMRISDLKVHLYADGADLAGLLELNKNPAIQGMTT